jgi:hypothetical protein
VRRAQCRSDGTASTARGISVMRDASSGLRHIVARMAARLRRDGSIEMTV